MYPSQALEGILKSLKVSQTPYKGCTEYTFVYNESSLIPSIYFSVIKKEGDINL